MADKKKDNEKAKERFVATGKGMKVILPKQNKKK